MCRPGTTSSPVLVSADAIWYHTRIVVRPYLKNTSLQLVTVDARVRLIHALLRTPDEAFHTLHVPEHASQRPMLSRIGRAQNWVGIVPHSTVQLGSFVLSPGLHLTSGCLELDLEYDTPAGEVAALAIAGLPPR